MKNNIIASLIKIANKLDELGLYKQANEIDESITHIKEYTITKEEAVKVSGYNEEAFKNIIIEHTDNYELQEYENRTILNWSGSVVLH